MSLHLALAVMVGDRFGRAGLSFVRATGDWREPPRIRSPPPRPRPRPASARGPPRPDAYAHPVP